MYEDLKGELPITTEFKLYSGSGNPQLAQEIADILGVELSGLKLEKFANGELYARFEESVRGDDVFVIQSMAGQNVNDLLMELLIIIDAAKRASARSVTAVIPHYAYARQDRKAAPREPITARLVANLLEAAGVDHVITLDLHQNQIQGFFDIAVTHLTALYLFGEYFKKKDFDWNNTVVVSPDVGRAKAAKRLSDYLGCSLAIAHKGRPKHNMAEVMAVIGDIEGKTCIINDDMIDTGGTLIGSINELKKMGAPIAECVVTNAIAEPDANKPGGKVKTISIANEFAECIYNVFMSRPVSGIFGGNSTI